jgi:hypothetical protein
MSNEKLCPLVGIESESFRKTINGNRNKIYPSAKNIYMETGGIPEGEGREE